MYSYCFLIAISILFGCTSLEDRLAEPLQEAIAYIPPSGSVSEQSLYRLNRLVMDNPDWFEISLDMRLSLEAMTLEEKGFASQAMGLWQDVIAVGRGKVAEYALNSWLDSTKRLLPQKVSEATVEKYLAGLAVKDKVIEKQLKDKAWRSKKLRAYGLYPEPSEVGRDLEHTAVELLSLGQAACDVSLKNVSGSLGGEVAYGFRLFCKDEFKKAMYVFKRIARSNPDLGSFKSGVSLGNMIVAAARRVGDREVISFGYELKAKYFQKYGKGLNSLEDVRSGLEDNLWAARYLALLGRYESAVRRVDFVLRTIESRAQSAEMRRLRAEAIHVLCFRIEFERGNVQRAERLTKSVLDWKNIGPGLRNRFTWYLGLYQYLRGSYSRSLETWEPLLLDFAGRSYNEKALFWSARASHQLRSFERRDEYLTLLDERFPLGFYSTQGLNMLRLAGREKLSSIQRVKVSLANTNPGRLLTQRKLRRAFFRAQLAIAAGHQKISGILLSELSQRIRESRITLLDNERIYLAKLWHLAGDFNNSIRTLSILPDKQIYGDSELMSMFFPEPYEKSYAISAQKVNLPKKVLLAISRQESLFNAEAESPAHAYGLMQLILPTARKYNENLTMDALFEPQLNISIASSYLEDLVKRFNWKYEAVYAAYNAGEYATDSWLLRRKSDDRLIFLEFVPFMETRNYIMKVLRNEFFYGSIRPML